MPGRRARRIKKPEQFSPPVQAGGLEALPEPTLATHTGGRRATEIRTISLTATADGDDTGQGTLRASRVTHIPRRRGKLHQMLDMPLDIIMEASSFIVVLHSSGFPLILVHTDMRQPSAQRYALFIQTFESVSCVLHPSECAVSVEVRGAQCSWPPAMSRGSQ